MALRRPHRKSRHGCVECKRRRVKCNEARPTCSNCSKRHSDCEYGSSSSLLWANEDPTAPLSRTSGSDTSSQCEGTANAPAAADSFVILGQLSGEKAAVTSPVPGLNLQDLELMMQWCNSMYRTLSRNEHTDPVWRCAVPEEALSHPFLMHGILALSALDLARRGPEQSRRAAYLGRAVAHQNQALALFRGLLGDINETNAKAMFSFASIVVVYTFGFPHTPEVHDAWACVDDLYQVLVLIRGVQQVIRDSREFLAGSAFAPILQVEDIQAPLPHDAKQVIDQLRQTNNACGLRDSDHETDVYESTIENFAGMLSFVYGGMTSSTIAGRWAIRLRPRFLELLRERQPLAIVMLAHYGVLLQHLEHQWCFDEWCVRVAQVVWAILDDQWRPLVHWAMKEILGGNYRDQIDT